MINSVKSVNLWIFAYFSTIFVPKFPISMNAIKLFLLIFTILVPSVVSSQSKPIAWRVNVKMQSPTDGEVIIKAIVEPGWHLYGTKLPEGGPKPTVIDMSGSTGVTFVSGLTYSPSTVEKTDAMFGLKLNWWESNVTFRRKFKVTEPGAAKISGTISFMGCDNHSCLPPVTEKFTKAIPVKK